jgi:hypothetical protein
MRPERAKPDDAHGAIKARMLFMRLFERVGGGPKFLFRGSQGIS